MRFGGDDVVRHKLVQRIVEAYDAHDSGPGQRAARRRSRITADERPEFARDRRDRRRAALGPRRRRPWPTPPPPRGSRRATSAVEFVDSERIAELNLTWRGKVGPTDVLSFPVDEDDEDPFGERELGDVFICPEHTEDLVEAVVHGVLHLTGMDHETDDGEMLAVQAEIMGWLR